MAYPPTVPPATRINATPQVDTHPADHNAISGALNDMVNELGSNPSGAFPTVTDRIDRIETRRGCGLVGTISPPATNNYNFTWQAEAWDQFGYHVADSATIIIPTGQNGMYLISLEVNATGGAVNGNCDIIVAAKGVAHHSYMFAGSNYAIPLVFSTDLDVGQGVEASVTNGHSVPMTFLGSIVVQWLSV